MFELGKTYPASSLDNNAIKGIVVIQTVATDGILGALGVYIDYYTEMKLSTGSIMDAIGGTWETEEGYVEFRADGNMKLERWIEPNYARSVLMLKNIRLVYADNLDVVEKLGKKILASNDKALPAGN